ncbi:RidA family protein [Saccharothrix sp. NPDC042600]|uniref:RidA family protein n=1 Tax=Saccharothrix TaxID=2071 RepID=UPI0033F06861|nr:RidA family protein [Saccharothrix mutabilis subsp. capreolus]
MRVTNPDGLHDPVPFGYSHVVSARATEVVFIAGQYASGPDGHVVSDDFAEQVAKSLDNLRIALAAEGLGFGDVVRIGSHIVDHDETKLAIWAKAVHEVWGDEPPAQTLVGVAALALPDMKFEVDAIAVRS